MDDDILKRLKEQWDQQNRDYQAFNSNVIDLDSERLERMASKDEIELLKFIKKVG